MYKLRFLLFFACVFCFKLTYAQHPIVPTPKKITEKEGRLLINTGAISIPFHVLSEEERLFFKDLLSVHGLELHQTIGEPMVRFQSIDSIAAEGYVLEIDDDIQISYSDKKGRFHALMSLLQLLDQRKHITYLNRVRIEDEPRFEWRGLHLDVSRHFFTVEEIKRFLDLMALYKFNTFHWHLTDDQGWRIEIDQYPELTSIGGFRDRTVIGHFSDSPRQYDQNQYGGFYTKEDVSEIVQYAAVRNINVVPEIEMPGHSRAALAAYPEFSCSGEQQGVPGLWGVFEDIYCSKESSIEFLQNILDEVLEMFPSEYIHIGGDEAPKFQWNSCDDCQKVMLEQGLHDAHELQSYFIGRMDQYLTEKGRKLIGWDEILEGGLSPNAAVMSWRGEEGGIEAAKQGHFVVMSPTTYCYFDYYQSSHDSEPLAIGGYLPLEKVYQYDPVPAALTEEESRYVLGGQANVWTEYIPDFNQVEYMVFPRALALIQGLWCHEKPAYEVFQDDYIMHHEWYLKKYDVNVAPSVRFPKISIKRSDYGVDIAWKTTNPDEVLFLSEESECLGFGLGDEAAPVKNGAFVGLTRINSGRCETTCSVNSRFFKSALSYTFHQSRSLGAPVDITPDPHPKYNNNGSLNIVDGIIGEGGRWKGDQWLGFRDKEIVITVDLEELTEVNYVSIGFLNQNGSWIYLPETVLLEISEDGEEWTERIEGVIESEGEKVYRGSLPCHKEVKYVRLTVHSMDAIPEGNGGAGSTPWTFIDEIQVF